MTVLLRTDGLSKSFGGVHPLTKVSLDVRSGTTFGLIGPNGAGKTTLFNVLTGYLRPDEGRVVFNGQNITGLPPHRIWRHGIGRTFQITRVFGSLTVFENVLVAIQSAKGRNLCWYFPSKARATDELNELLELVHLSENRNARADTLPLPNQKRLEVAIAMAAGPRLLLLDEPTAGMGEADRDALFRAIERIKIERGLTLVIVEHDVSLVFAFCDTVAVLHQGNVVAVGSPDTIRRNTCVQQIYLGGEARAQA